jgi:hypothetical protein
VLEAQPGVVEVDAQGRETLGNGGLLRIEGAMHGQRAQSRRRAVQAQVSVGMLVEEARDATARPALEAAPAQQHEPIDGRADPVSEDRGKDGEADAIPLLRQRAP